MTKKKEIEIPSKIRVGYQDVSVHVISAEKDGRLEDSEGFYQSSKAMICINEKQCVSEQFATLIHESLHAVFYTYGMREIIDDKEKEEYIVNTISNAFIQMMKDNPVLLNGFRKL